MKRALMLKWHNSLVLAEEADVVLFLVDAGAGMLPADQGIADHLRRINKKVFVVANKVDGIDGDSESAEFYSGREAILSKLLRPTVAVLCQLLQDALKPLESDFAGNCR